MLNTLHNYLKERLSDAAITEFENTIADIFSGKERMPLSAYDTLRIAEVRLNARLDALRENICIVKTQFADTALKDYDAGADFSEEFKNFKKITDGYTLDYHDTEYKLSLIEIAKKYYERKPLS